jgi:hypothetical protein
LTPRQKTPQVKAGKDLENRFVYSDSQDGVAVDGSAFVCV